MKDLFEQRMISKEKSKQKKLFKNKKGIYKSREVIPPTRVEVIKKKKKPKYREDFFNEEEE